MRADARNRLRRALREKRVAELMKTTQVVQRRREESEMLSPRRPAIPYFTESGGKGDNRPSRRSLSLMVKAFEHSFLFVVQGGQL